MRPLLDIRPGEQVIYFHPSYRADPGSLIYNALPSKNVSLHVLVADATTHKESDDCFCYDCKDSVTHWLAEKGWLDTTIWSADALARAGLDFQITSIHRQSPLWSPNPMLQKHMDKIPENSIVLDVGSGVGRDAVIMAMRNLRVICIERRPKLAHVCKTICDQFDVPCEVVDSLQNKSFISGVTVLVATVDQALLSALKGQIDVVHISRFFDRQLLVPLKQIPQKAFFLHHFFAGSIRPASRFSPTVTGT